MSFMVGIIIISHNKKISEGIKEVIEQMIGKNENVKISCVGGEAGSLGTNVSEIIKAIDEVYDKQGVLIFVDFGSTALGAKTALNLIDDERKSNIHIVNAPIVEGAFVAAVEASLGKSMEEILKSVEEAKNMNKAV